MTLSLTHGSLGEVKQLIDQGCSEPSNFGDLCSDSKILIVNDDGQLVGFGTITHSLHGQPLGPKQVFVHVGVVPPSRRRGIGSELLHAVMSQARSLGASQVSASVGAEDEGSLEFAKTLRFRIDYRIYECSLDLSRFDSTAWEAGIEALRARGIRFATLAEYADRKGITKAIYDLDHELSLDIPQWAGYMPPFESYESELLAEPEGVILAISGDELVGISITVVEPEGVAYGSFMGLKRSHRGLGIARALKLLSIEWAQRRGLSRMLSHNNASSLPILGLNRQLGYELQLDAVYLMRSIQ